MITTAAAGTGARRRGGPLAMLALLIGAWVAGRAVLWESPFPLSVLPAADRLFAQDQPGQVNSPNQVPGQRATPVLASLNYPSQTISRIAMPGLGGPIVSTVPGSGWLGYSTVGQSPALAAGHQYLMNAAFEIDWHSQGLGAAFGPRLAARGQFPVGAPFAARQRPATPGSVDRWSLDTFAFYRAGSGSLSTSQGRVPVYGASQISANLQYRIAPASQHDPRGYLRAYHALVSGGETEMAAGLSARPLAQLPVRLAGELRVTRNPFGTDYRPAGFAVTEIPPQRLPLDFSLETYAGAGYVGGKAATYFIDGQAAVTRELATFGGEGDSPLRFSLGGAAWGGAQDNASRLDIGPTMRLDLNVGEVPARISVDWRERIAGDAAPDSGVAATVSTRF